MKTRALFVPKSIYSSSADWLAFAIHIYYILQHVYYQSPGFGSPLEN